MLRNFNKISTEIRIAKHCYIIKGDDCVQRVIRRQKDIKVPVINFLERLLSRTGEIYQYLERIIYIIPFQHA